MEYGGAGGLFKLFAVKLHHCWTNSPYIATVCKLCGCHTFAKSVKCEGGFRGEHQGERRACNHDDAKKGESSGGQPGNCCKG